MARVKVGVDATFLYPGRVGGVEFMLKNLLEGLCALAGERGIELRVAAPHPWSTDPSIAWDVTAPGNRFVRGTQAAWRMRRDVDHLLAPNYFTPGLPGDGLPATTTVIHDLQYRHYPQYFSARKRAWLRFAHRVTLERARRVVVLSSHGRDDILSAYGQAWAPKLRVVPNPVSWRRFEAAPDAPDGRGPTTGAVAARRRPGSAPTEPATRRPTVLSVSAHWPHKNVETLLRAFRLLQDRHGADAPALVLVGQLAPNLVSGPTSVDLHQVILGLHLKHVTVTGHVDDATLGRLYAGADLFVFPSLFEGFGMPPVEALGMGLPVLTTARTSLPEVTLGLASIVDDPLDADAWATRIERMLADPAAYRPSPQDVARVRAHYDPVRIAGAYLDVMLEGA